MSTPFKRRPSTICVCGKAKEHIEQRYCDSCEEAYVIRWRAARCGKGIGKRKFGWNKKYATDYWKPTPPSPTPTP